MKKIAIRVTTEFDRENVIAWFEKHYPECNKAWKFGIINCVIGDVWLLDNYGHLSGFTQGEVAHGNRIFTDYTIIEGVPTDLSMPSDFKTREQELEECLRKIIKCTGLTMSNTNILKQERGLEFSDAITKAKQLLSK